MRIGKEDKRTETGSGFLSGCQYRKRFLRIFCLVLIFVVTADTIVHKHAVWGWEVWVGFFAGYGIVSCLLLLVAAKLWAELTKRDEGYYG
jgi:hypothetical protein